MKKFNDWLINYFSLTGAIVFLLYASYLFYQHSFNSAFWSLAYSTLLFTNFGQQKLSHSSSAVLARADKMLSLLSKENSFLDRSFHAAIENLEQYDPTAALSLCEVYKKGSQDIWNETFLGESK